MSKNTNHKQLIIMTIMRAVTLILFIISLFCLLGFFQISVLDSMSKKVFITITFLVLYCIESKTIDFIKNLKVVDMESSDSINNEQNISKEEEEMLNQVQSELERMLKSKGITPLVFKGNIAKPNLDVDEDTEEQSAEIPDVKFKDVIGLKEAKAELSTLVDFLKEPEKYEKAGAKLPKAVLLYGPPGTGKTTLAKALAGEAEVGFIYKTGSSFTNKYVGVGPHNIRKMFEEANKKAPCIIFIDEIECLGKSRTDSGNSEDLKTLDEFLSRLDGFTPNKGVLVVGATNKPDYLDEAFVRPGRFDSKISVPVPQTKEERLDIIKYYTKNKCLYDTVDLERLAKEMIGCSPAAIESVLNKAAIKQVALNEKAITNEMIEEAFTEYIMEGHLEKDRNNSRRKKELEIVAYHEAGHALVGSLLNREVCKVTIVGTTSGAGGFTRTIPEEKGLLSKRDLQNQIMELYGGRAAEEIYFNDADEITTGCSNDIERASKLIKAMVRRYGMGTDSNLLVADSSEELKRCFADEKEISYKLYENTLTLLRNNKEKLISLAEALIERETLTEDEIKSIIKGEKLINKEKEAVKVDKSMDAVETFREALTAEA